MDKVVVDPDPELPAGDVDWPYRGTREQVAAAEARLKVVRELHPKNSTEFRSANMHVNRLKRRKKGVRRFRSKMLADQEYKLRLIAESGKRRAAQAEKAIESLYGLAAQGRSAILMRQFVHLAETYGPQIMEERLKDKDAGTRYKALGELIDLLKTAYRTEEDKAPKKASGPRRVVVSWPNEGAKS